MGGSDGCRRHKWYTPKSAQLPFCGGAWCGICRAGPAASRAFADAQPVSTENIDAFEGQLLSFSAGTFEIQTDSSLRQVVALGGSTFWKGGETSWDGFSVGDTVLVRTVNGQLDRAWANLIQRRGVVLSGGSDAVAIALDDDGADQLAVSLPATTDFGTHSQGKRRASHFP